MGGVGGVHAAAGDTGSGGIAGGELGAKDVLAGGGEVSGEGCGVDDRGRHGSGVLGREGVADGEEHGVKGGDKGVHLSGSRLAQFGQHSDDAADRARR